MRINLTDYNKLLDEYFVHVDTVTLLEFLASVGFTTIINIGFRHWDISESEYTMFLLKWGV